MLQLAKDNDTATRRAFTAVMRLHEIINITSHATLLLQQQRIRIATFFWGRKKRIKLTELTELPSFIFIS